MTPWGLSIWTLGCLGLFFLGIIKGRLEISVYAILLYILGWILRIMFGTTKEERKI